MDPSPETPTKKVPKQTRNTKSVPPTTIHVKEIVSSANTKTKKPKGKANLPVVVIQAALPKDKPTADHKKLRDSTTTHLKATTDRRAKSKEAKSPKDGPSASSSSSFESTSVTAAGNTLDILLQRKEEWDKVAKEAISHKELNEKSNPKDWIDRMHPALLNPAPNSVPGDPRATTKRAPQVLREIVNLPKELTSIQGTDSAAALATLLVPGTGDSRTRGAFGGTTMNLPTAGGAPGSFLSATTAVGAVLPTAHTVLQMRAAHHIKKGIKEMEETSSTESRRPKSEERRRQQDDGRCHLCATGKWRFPKKGGNAKCTNTDCISNAEKGERE